jgi:methyl-accepting chemotaxis protein WspA
MKLTVRNRIIVSFTVLIAILMLMATASYWRMSVIEGEADSMLTNSVPGAYYASKMQDNWARHMLDTRRLMLRIMDKDYDQELEAHREEFATLERSLDELLTLYQQASVDESERVLAEQFQQQHRRYLTAHKQLLDVLATSSLEESRKLSLGTVFPEWDKGQNLLTEIIELNKTLSDSAASEIRDSVRLLEIGMLIAVLLTIAAAITCGGLLLRAITTPINNIVRILNTLESGDLSVRLNMQRQDEFNAIEIGFNSMVGEPSARPCKWLPRSPKLPPPRANNKPPPPKRQRPPPKSERPRGKLRPPRGIWCAP